MRYIIELPVHGMHGFDTFRRLTLWRPGQRGYSGQLFELELQIDSCVLLWTRTNASGALKLYRAIRGLVQAALANPLP